MTEFVIDHVVCADINSASGTLAVGTSSRVEIGRRGSAVGILGDLLVTGPLTVNSQSSQEFTLPQTRGTANQLLISDGQGSTSWSNAPPPPGVVDTIQDAAGTTKVTCATAGQIDCFLPGMSGPAIQASSSLASLTTPSFENATGGSSLVLFDNGGWSIANNSRSGSLSASRDSQPAELNISTVNAVVELRDSQIRTSIANSVRDTLDAVKREFSGTDEVARMTIDDTGVNFGSGLSAYRFPSSSALSANKSLVSDGSVLHFQFPTKLESTDQSANVSCGINGSSQIQNFNSGVYVFSSSGQNTAVYSPGGTSSLSVTDGSGATLTTIENFTVNCSNMGLNGQLNVDSVESRNNNGTLSLGTSSTSDVTISQSGSFINLNGKVTIGDYSLPSTAGSLGDVLSITAPLEADWMPLPSLSGFALTANPLSQFAATTSLQLYQTISDPNGNSGSQLVFSDSPSLTTPNIGDAGATSLLASNFVHSPAFDSGVGSLSVGTLNATGITIGKTGIATTINGDSTNIEARLNTRRIDVASSTMLLIGTQTATGVVIGGPNSVNANIEIGWNGVITAIFGTLKVSGAYDLPVSQGNANEVLVSQGSTSVWKRPCGFTQTFGGNVDGNDFFLVNGTVYSPVPPGSGGPGFGNRFIVPVACTLKRLTSDFINLCDITIYKNTNAEANVSLPIGIFSADFAPISLGVNEYVSIKQVTFAGGVRTGTICLYFE